MIAVVSPAKSLDFETPTNVKATQPRLLECTNQLIDVLRKKSPEDIKELMSISDNLAELNVSRYHSYKPTHSRANAKPSVLAFQGDVYQGLKAETFDEATLEFAQKHFRILSGLYGLLRPLDLIQPYRLEMGTKLAFDDYTESIEAKKRDLETEMNTKSRDFIKDLFRRISPTELAKLIAAHSNRRA